MSSDDADADDTDAVGSNLAPKGKRSCEQSGNLQLSLQQIAIGFSVGSWLLLCLVEVAAVAADGELSDPRWWSFLIGGVILLITLVLIVVSRMQARSTAERKFTSVAPVERGRSDEPKAPEDSRWNVIIHGHLMAGALLWIAVHIVNDQYQQVWRGLTTLYSIIGFGTVGVFCGRPTLAASDRRPPREAGGDPQQRQRLGDQGGGADGRNLKKPAAAFAAAAVEPPAACPRSLGVNGGIKQKWQPLFRDPTFGNSVDGAPQVGRRASVNSRDEAVVAKRSSMKSRASFKFLEDDVQAWGGLLESLDSQQEQVAQRSSSRSRANVCKFVEDAADAPAEAAAPSPVGYELRRQQSKSSHCSAGSAMSDVSKSEEKPQAQAASSTECKPAVSHETKPHMSKPSGSSERGGSSANCGIMANASMRSDGSALSDMSAAGIQAQAKKVPAPSARQQLQPLPGQPSGSSSVDPGGQRSAPSKNSVASAGSALSDISGGTPPKPQQVSLLERLLPSSGRQQPEAPGQPRPPAGQPSSSSFDPGGQRSMPSKSSVASALSALSDISAPQPPAAQQQAASSSDCVLVSLPE